MRLTVKSDEMCDPLQAQYAPKPPRRLLLHLWGGLCLNSFAEASGLSELIIDTFISYQGEIESGNLAARAAGALTALLILIGYYLSSRLVLVIENSVFRSKQKEQILFSLPFIYFIVVFLLVMVTSLAFIGI